MNYDSSADSALAQRNLRLTKVMYWLQILHFFFGISYIIAIVMNYIYRPEVRATWLESHFIWQARTFWYSLLWYFLGGVLSIILIGYVILALNFFWLIYRTLIGLRALRLRRSLYGTVN